ncbi:MAG: hypothetical protein Q8R28_11375 [Dehalococcoidia bacterium]|nr:hypothetical protein [Dehalococcoidia bacterium]
MQEQLHVCARPRAKTADDVLRRWPCLVAHMVCESLGYMTPRAAANAICDVVERRSNWCEWYYSWAGQRFSELLEKEHRKARPGEFDETIKAIGEEVLKNAISRRKYHTGMMADYPMARALVEAERRGIKLTPGTELMAW